MDNQKVYSMSFTKVYHCLVNKALRKNCKEDEVISLINWLTGYSKEDINRLLPLDISYKDFFEKAPKLNPNRVNIKGTVCHVKIEEIEDNLMKEIRYLDKIIDELTKGKPVDKIICKYM